MICKKPFRKDGRQFGCGQCLPCRINKRRLWASRIMLEARMHGASSFVTLTYSDENLPQGGTLVPRHLVDWQKRLRYYAKTELRFFSIGEYGDQTWRPHYHAAVFGLDPLDSDVLARSWTVGHVHMGDLTPDSAAYLAGYLTKKMTNKDDPRLSGRYPEFARMSRNPGIGVKAVPIIASALSSSAGARLIGDTGDVPLALKEGKKSLPLGRLLRRKLREEIGFDEIGEQPSAPVRQAAELFVMCEREGSVKAALEKQEVERLVKVRQAETKHSIWSKKGSI